MIVIYNIINIYLALTIKIHYLQSNFLDDGILSGPRAALSRAMEIIQGDSTLNGLLINFKKCQLLSKQDLSMFHPEILCCSTPNFEILGAPIGSPDFCTVFVEGSQPITIPSA